MARSKCAIAAIELLLPRRDVPVEHLDGDRDNLIGRIEGKLRHLGQRRIRGDRLERGALLLRPGRTGPVAASADPRAKCHIARREERLVDRLRLGENLVPFAEPHHARSTARRETPARTAAARASPTRPTRRPCAPTRSPGGSALTWSHRARRSECCADSSQADTSPARGTGRCTPRRPRPPAGSR